MVMTRSERRAIRMASDAARQTAAMLDGEEVLPPSTRSVNRPARRRRKTGPKVQHRFQRGDRVRIAGYHHPDGLVAATGSGPYLPVVVAGRAGPVMHWLAVARLTPSTTPGSQDKLMRRYMHSAAGESAARRKPPKHPDSLPRPAANRAVRGLDGGHRHRVHLIG
jgi:hypothetical protein